MAVPENKIKIMKTNSLTKHLFLGFFACSALSAGSALAGGVFYTIKPPATGGNFELYKIDLVDGPTNTATASLLSTSTLTCANCSNANRVNGFSYNPNQNNVFFFNSTSAASPILYSVQAVNSGTFTQVASLTDIAANTNLSGAAFFDNTIYAIANNSQTVYKIPVTYGGSGINVGTISSFNVGAANRAYGDLAIDPKTKTLYGYSTSGGTNGIAYWSYDLVNNQLITTPQTQTQSGLQIAFGNSDPNLYAIGPTGEWYTINKDTGNPTPYALFTGGDSLGSINDLAGGIPVVPGPLPVLGAAAAFRASRRLRKRVGHLQPSSKKV